MGDMDWAERVRALEEQLAQVNLKLEKGESERSD